MMEINKLIRDLDLIRRNSPLIHSITNYVVMNNTANALLAIGASPVMAHAKNEVVEMVNIASALVINIGTLDDQWVESMLIAGKAALANSIPVILDPVGAGATTYRTNICNQLIEECRPAIIRGNASEIIALCGNAAQTKGVDSINTSDSAIESAKKLASTTKAIVVISGQTDYITDGIRVEEIYNGHILMARVTGMGCTATAIVGAFAAVNPDQLEAATHAMAVMGVVGEIAANKSYGNGSMQVNFLDELCNIDAEGIRKHIKR